MNERKRAIDDLQWQRRELLNRPTAEQLVAKIETAKKALADGKLREYRQTLKQVIQKVVVYMRPLPKKKKPRGRQKYETVGITITPVNPAAIPFERQCDAADAMFDASNVPCLRYEPMPGCTLTVARDDDAMAAFDPLGHRKRPEKRS